MVRLHWLCCGLCSKNAETVVVIVPTDPPLLFLFLLQSQATRPEQSVMQALESLTETQVRGFLKPPSLPYPLLADLLSCDVSRALGHLCVWAHLSLLWIFSLHLCMGATRFLRRHSSGEIGADMGRKEDEMSKLRKRKPLCSSNLSLLNKPS